MKKHDIGILTLWNVPNYGTFVQAYALQKFIEKLSGREVVQISKIVQPIVYECRLFFV